jgi:hypothetical protein
MDTVRKFAWDGVMGVLGHPLTPYIAIMAMLLQLR